MGEVKGTLLQNLQALKLKTSYLEEEVRSARYLKDQSLLDSARSKSRLRRLGEQLDESGKDLDNEIHLLEWDVEKANQERTQLQTDVDKAKDLLEATISKYTQKLEQLKAMHAEKESNLRAELTMYQTELETLKEFQNQRAQIEDELRQLDQTLVKHRKVHKLTVEQFNQQLAREKEQFEVEIRSKVEKAKMKAVSIKDKNLEDAAAKIIQENQATSHQLKKNRIRAKDILDTNRNLNDKIKYMQQENQLLTEREGMLMGDVSRYKRQIEDVKIKIQEYDVVFARDKAKLETNAAIVIEKLEEEYKEAATHNEELRKEVDFLEKKIADVEGQKSMTGSKQTKLMSLLSSTAPTVLTALKATDADNSAPSSLDRLIQKLSIMAGEENTAAPASASPEPTSERKLVDFNG